MRLTRLVWAGMGKVFSLVARPMKTYEGRDRVMALYAPLTLLLLPFVWLLLVITGYTLMFKAVDVDSWRTAFTESGSSLFTLGFVRPSNLPATVLAFTEATFGLGLLALLISYLPSIYSVFSRREVQVAQLSARAGTPPSPVFLFIRVHRIGRLEELEDVWITWQHWFAELEETHTSQASLVFLRSPRHDRSWITAAGCILDSASLYLSTVDVERTPDAALCVRAGTDALRAIASFFDVGFDEDPQPSDAIEHRPRGVRRRLPAARAGGRPAEAGPGPGVARLQRLARELRRAAGGDQRAGDGALRDVVLGPVAHPAPAGSVAAALSSSASRLTSGSCPVRAW